MYSIVPNVIYYSTRVPEEAIGVTLKDRLSIVMIRSVGIICQGNPTDTGYLKHMFDIIWTSITMLQIFFDFL